MTETQLPGSLQEYLMVWCGDLLAGLDAASRAQVVRHFVRIDSGGAWPSRGRVQRHVEWVTGELAASPLPELTPAPVEFPPLPAGYPHTEAVRDRW